MKILLTGGAGFIGSNLTEYLLEDERVSLVRIFDDLSNGDYNNIKEFEDHPKFEFLKADIRDAAAVNAAAEGMDKICHQAAVGSVPRSIKDPITTHEVNVNGTLNVFQAAVINNIKKVVFASSSSVYGDELTMPKIEEKTGNALSPYALTKSINEQYAEVFSKSYDFNYIALRYFNVFGAKQSPKGPYAAVIPIFVEKALNNQGPVINGDGNFSRDFTYVKNAVMANVNALFTENPAALNEAYNVAYGERATLNQLWQAIKESTACTADAIHGPERNGDIPHSLANISKAKSLLNYDPKYSLQDGLATTVKWYKESLETTVS